jgi:hypothetical protein
MNDNTQNSMRGVVYSTASPPSDPFFQLSNDDIASLMKQATGLPIRIEHETHDVGRVVSASFNGVDAVVEWEFSENASGWAAEKLVELQQIKELSLKHVAYENGNKKPLEVSLVRKGARPATTIIHEKYKTPVQTSLKEQHTVVMASASDAGALAAIPPPDVAAPVAPEAVAVADAAAAVGAMPMTSTEEPASKRAKFESPLEFINSISTKISDVETMQMVADYIAQSLEANIASEHEIKALKEAKAILENSQKLAVAGSKNVIGDITNVLCDIFGTFAKDSQVSEDSKAAFMDTMAANVKAMEFVRPILVAASAIHQRTAMASFEANNNHLNVARARVEALTNQLANARKMSPVGASQPVAMSVQPGWTTMPPPAIVATPQAVTVAASGAGAPMSGGPPAFKMPAIIGELTSFKDQGGQVGMFTSSMLSKRA